METKRIFPQNKSLVHSDCIDESLDYKLLEESFIVRKPKRLGIIKILNNNENSYLKRSFESSDSYRRKKYKHNSTEKLKINFRYPKVVDFLFTRPCDEIIKYS